MQELSYSLDEKWNSSERERIRQAFRRYMSLRLNSMHIIAGGPWTHRWHGPTKTHLCRRENVPAFQTWDVANPRTTEPILFLLQYVEFYFYFNLLNFLSLVYRWDRHFEIYLFKIFHFNISADIFGFVPYPWICLLLKDDGPRNPTRRAQEHPYRRLTFTKISSVNWSCVLS